MANSIGTATEAGGELRITQYRVRSVLTGTDASRLTRAVAVWSGKVTVNGRGDLVIDRFEIPCGRPTVWISGRDARSAAPMRSFAP
jgi:hypothetical protein